MEYEFVDSILSEGENKKKYELDNLLKDPNNNYIIVEMQRYNADEKNISYLFRVAGNTLKRGKTKYELSRNVLIQFDAYEISGITKEVLKYELQETELGITKKGIEIYEFILPNFSKFSYNKIDKRLSMFMCKSYEEMRMIDEEAETEEIIDELELLNMDENFSFLYDAEVGKELELYGAKKQGIEEGIEEGKQQLITTLVLKMVEEDKSVNEISNFLNISIEEVEKIIAKTNK